MALLTIPRRTRLRGASLRLGTVLALAGTSFASAAPAPRDAGRAARFESVVQGVWPDAAARGTSRATFEAAFAGVVFDPGIAAITARQPEFAKPIGAYLAAQVTAGRIAQGRAALDRWRDDLAAIETRTGVPAAIVVAVWGLESGYGGATGTKDVIRSLATLVTLGIRPELYRGELLAALTMLQNGDVRRADLRGSWAGAMGQPQFMPSSFLAHAVDQDGDGRRNIWTDVPDVLASIGNFLQAQGWRAGGPWGFPVRLAPGFDVGTGRGSFAEWTARGIARLDGQALPAAGDAALFFPAGATGPAFLATVNYEVLKTYNFSDAYVLSVADLADRMAGRPAMPSAWPSEPSMARDQRMALQARLVALGYPVDNREGRISLALRDVIRTAQARVGLVPDGNPTPTLLRALETLPNRE